MILHICIILGLAALTFIRVYFACVGPACISYIITRNNCHELRRQHLVPLPSNLYQVSAIGTRPTVESVLIRLDAHIRITAFVCALGCWLMRGAYPPLSQHASRWRTALYSTALTLSTYVSGLPITVAVLRVVQSVFSFLPPMGRELQGGSNTDVADISAGPALSRRPFRVLSMVAGNTLGWCAQNTRRFVVMAGKSGDGPPGAKGFSWIRAVHGQVMFEELMQFLNSAYHDNRAHDNDEAFYIQTLKSCLAPHHPIRSLLQTPDSTLGGAGESVTPEAYATALARAHEHRYEAQRAASRTPKRARDVVRVEEINDAYPPYSVDPKWARIKAKAEAILSDDQGVYRVAKIRQADADLEAAIQYIADSEAEYNSATTYQKWIVINKPEHVARLQQFLTRYNFRCEEIDGSRSTEPENRKGKRFDDAQFKKVDNMQALNWLAQHIMSRIGNINQHDVEQFRKMRLKHGESPIQAYSRVLEAAKLLEMSNVMGFSKDLEIWKLVTSSGTAGADAFLTSTLHTAVDQVVTARLDAQGIDRNNLIRVTETWIHCSEERFHRGQSATDAIYLAVQAECLRREASPKAGQASGSNANANQSKQTQDKAQAKGKAPAQGQAKTGKYHCSVHGANNSHDTSTCRLRLADPATQGQAPVPPPGPAPKKTFTSLPSPGPDALRAKGMRPNTAYGREAQTTPRPPSPAYASATDRQYGICKKCTSIAGREISHNQPCYVDGVTRVPETYNPFNYKLRAEANRIRALQGQAVPPPPISQKVLATHEQPGDEGWKLQRVDSTAYRVNVMRTPILPDNRSWLKTASVRSHLDAEVPITSQLEFDSVTRTFTCIQDNCPCQNTRDPATGLLLRTTCTECGTSWPQSKMPRNWITSVIWSFLPPAALSADSPSKPLVFKAPETTFTSQVYSDPLAEVASYLAPSSAASNHFSQDRNQEQTAPSGTAMVTSRGSTTQNQFGGLTLGRPAGAHTQF